MSTPTTADRGPLSGFRIIDLTENMAGPGSFSQLGPSIVKTARIWLTMPLRPCSMKVHTITQATVEVMTGAKNTARKKLTPLNCGARVMASISARETFIGTSPAVKVRLLRSMS